MDTKFLKVFIIFCLIFICFDHVSAATAVNGSCGSAHDKAFYSAPTTNLCFSGNASAIVGDGPWYWTCYGQNGGNNAVCVAQKASTNHNPSIYAGSDKSIYEGQNIVMNATASDLDNDSLIYSWSCNGGRLSSSSVLGPIYYAPQVSYSLTYACVLSVYDGKGGYAFDSVNINVKDGGNTKPIVNAGGDKEVEEGQKVYLNATASDANDDSLTYSWSCGGGKLSNYKILNPDYYAPQVSKTTVYTCSLSVSDNRGGYASDSFRIIVKDKGDRTTFTEPYIDAGDYKEIGAGQSVYMNATAFDQDTYSFTYSWTCDGGTLSNYSILNPTFFAPQGGPYNITYTCTLAVGDGRGGYASDSVNILVRNDSIYRNLVVSVRPATNIGAGFARLNGYLADDSGDAVAVRLSYGQTDLDNATDWVYNKKTGDAFYADVYNLEKGKAYSFRAEAKNSRGMVYSLTNRFITKADAPSNFNIKLISDNQVQLFWDIGQGSCNTMVVKKIGSYPSSTTDGTIVYYGQGNGYIDADIVLGKSYYYRAWSVACDENLFSWSDSLSSRGYINNAKTSINNESVVPQKEIKPETVSGLDLSVSAINITNKESDFKESVSASPGQEIEVKIIVSPKNNKAVENVVLTNMLPVKISDISDLRVDNQGYCADETGSIFIGDIKEPKSITFKLTISDDNSFDFGDTDLYNNIQASAKNVEPVNSILTIKVSKTMAKGLLASITDFISNNRFFFYLGFGLVIGFIFFIILYSFLAKRQEKKKKQEEVPVLEKSKYFTIQ